jgi:hypothetical protein
MFSIEDFIISVFCCVDDLLQLIIQEHPIRAKGFAPGLSDSEVLTMEIVGGYQGIDTDKGIWQYFQRHWRSWFPLLRGRSTFARQAANLWQYKQIIQTKLAAKLRAFSSDIHLVDGLLIPLCSFRRTAGCRLFPDLATYGYCAAKQQIYYGFHGHLLVTETGIITGFCLTPANGSERAALWDLVPSIQGLLIGDKGYLSAPLKAELQHHGIQLETPYRANMQELRSSHYRALCQRTRRLIETVIGQLSERFSIATVWARDLWYLVSRLNRKLLAHTVGYWLNLHSPDPLQFEFLVSP